MLLIAGSHSYAVEDFLDAAAGLGIDIALAADYSSPFEDASLQVDFAKPQSSLARIEALAARGPLAAVVAIDDAGLEIATLASASLSLPHNDLAAVRRTTNKLAFRQCLRQTNLPAPSFAVAQGAAGTAEAAATIGFPCVLKPLSLNASQGVVRVDDETACMAVVEDLFNLLRLRYPAGHAHRDKLLVESYLPGREVSLDALLLHGEAQAIAVFDKPEPMEGPYFAETIFTTPSCESETLVQAMNEAAATAAKALGLRHGPLHAEFRITASANGSDLPVLIELAPRSIGGLCSRALHNFDGPGLEAQILSAAIGEPLPLRWPCPDHQAARASGVMMINAPAAGTLSSVQGLEDARRISHITDIVITARRGERLRPVPFADSYIGFIYARGARPAQVAWALRASRDRITLEMAPVCVSDRDAS